MWIVEPQQHTEERARAGPRARCGRLFRSAVLLAKSHLEKGGRGGDASHGPLRTVHIYNANRESRSTSEAVEKRIVQAALAQWYVRGHPLRSGCSAQRWRCVGEEKRQDTRKFVASKGLSRGKGQTAKQGCAACVLETFVWRRTQRVRLEANIARVSAPGRKS